MTQVTERDVFDILSKIQSPEGGGNLVSDKLVENVFVSEGKVIVSIAVPADRAKQLEPLRVAVENSVKSLPGVEKATAVLTAERKAGAGAPPPKPSEAGQTGEAARPKPAVPGIGSIIAVASGKGGVGKSTTSVNLALGLKEAGLTVGILDADIYGPSMPRLLGINEKPTAQGRVLNPLEALGIKVMSMGFLVEEETPVIWRGPMVISALNQMLREVAWGELDVLVVDMPPGTGDAQLTMAQQVPLAGAVIVSTPQDLALIDARKGLNMFRKVEVPILGIIENMSYFICPKCGHRSDIFGNGGAREEAERLGIPFLGEIPLHMEIRSNSDAGTPITHSQPESEHAKIYSEIAASVIIQLNAANADTAGPAIIFE